MKDVASHNPARSLLPESGPPPGSTRVECLGMTFESDAARREYFLARLKEKLPEIRQRPDFPAGEDEDILRLSDPPTTPPVPIRS